MFWLGALIGLAAIILIYAVTMWVYFFVRKKFAGAKYAVEVVFVLAAVALSVFTKIVIAYVTNEQTAVSGLANFWYSLYAGIGGLAFEGLWALGEINGAILQCLYTGSSVYAGLVFVSVVTAKASYEIYSGILLLVLWLDKKRDLFLFATVTEDSLALALSIKEEYDARKKRRDKFQVKKCKIIFAGTQLESFDRKNPLHREIMANGYLYWSYAKSKNKAKKSVLKRLRLTRDNDFCDSKARAPQSRIHFFALDNNSSLSGRESQNGDIVFDEIIAITAERISKKRHKKTIVDFYILTDGEINYEYYQNAVQETVRKTIDGYFGIKIDDTEKNRLTLELSQLFTLHILDEADITARLFAEERNRLFGEKSNGANNIFARDVAGDEFSAMVLGFGRTGQQVMLQAYAMSTDVKERPNRFTAHVYDQQLDKRIGVFELRHPLVCCGADEAEIKDKRAKVCAIIVNEVCVREESENTDVKAAARTKKEIQKYIEQQMTFPQIVKHECSCFSTEFIRSLDKVTGRASQSQKFNLIVISLGDDELNIQIANALLEDIKHELSRLRHVENALAPQCIAIHLRDENNYGRINWRDGDESCFNGLYVSKFGKRKDVYSYSRIVDEEESMRYNHGYTVANAAREASKRQSGMVTHPFKEAAATIDEEQNTVKVRAESRAANEVEEKTRRGIESCGIIGDSYRKGEERAQGYTELLHQVNEAISLRGVDCRREWRSVRIFDKASNLSAALYQPVMSGLRSARCQSLTTFADLRYLAQLEHERWNRFYIASGWTYSSQKRKELKEHDCLLPYDLLLDSFTDYDIVNVARVYEEK